jgi:putative transposase
LQQYPIRKVCQRLKIASSSYYYHLHHPSVLPFTEEERNAVVNMFCTHFGNFGRRIIHRELLKQNICISEPKITKILKYEDLSSKYGRKKCKNVHTHKNTSEKYIAENIYRKLEKSENEEERKILKENTIWSIDFTEEKINGKKVISCGVIDVNKKVLISLIKNCSNTAESAVKCVKQGIEAFGKPYMIMTDRGSPFTSKLFHDLLADKKIIHSMSRPHTPVDNRFIETFWKSMKTEMGKVNYLSVEQYLMIVEFYEYYYNYQRPHSSLKYTTPLSA